MKVKTIKIAIVAFVVAAMQVGYANTNSQTNNVPFDKAASDKQFQEIKAEYEKTVGIQHALSGFAFSGQVGWLRNDVQNNINLGLNLGYQQAISDNFAIGLESGAQLAFLNPRYGYSNRSFYAPIMTYGQFVASNGLTLQAGVGTVYARQFNGNSTWMPAFEAGIGVQEKNKTNVSLMYTQGFSNNSLRYNSVVLRVTGYFG